MTLYREYANLGKLIDWLQIASMPGTSNYPDGSGTRSQPSSKPPQDAPSGSRFRKLQDVLVKRLRYLIRDMEIQVNGGYLRGSRCANCQTGPRHGAHYCDHCGYKLPVKRASKSHA